MTDFLVRQTLDRFEFVPSSPKGLAWAQKAGQLEELGSDHALVRNQAAAKSLISLLRQSGLSVETDAQELPASQADSTAKNGDFWERSFAEPKFAKYGCIPALLVLFAFPVALVTYCTNQNTEAVADQQRVDATNDAEQAAKKAEDRRKGFNCLSDWDGSEPDVVNLVKERLRDPNSFEHIETQITPKDSKGLHHVMMRYRSRNGFGGMTEGTALATVLNLSDRCVASLVALNN